MSLKIGIVGLPNVGKSTLFNALTNAGALAANYPFATIEPNVGIVPVPDERLAKLSKIYNSEKIIPATVEFVDIAGLVAGASKGEGLGNKFLAHIRECEIICHVVRAFDDNKVLHVSESVDPKRDIEVIQTELELADLETKERIVARRKKNSEDNNVEFLTDKPVIYVFNVSEQDLNNDARKKELTDLVKPSKAIFINAKLEEEMADMKRTERLEFLASYNIHQDALGELIRVAYDTLGLQSYLTAGKKETRAWTIKKGSTAPEAAGVIHSDFKRGFIAAEVMKYEDLINLGSEQAVKAAGKLATVGKTYVMEEGDVVEFRFNV